MHSRTATLISCSALGFLLCVLPGYSEAVGERDIILVSSLKGTETGILVKATTPVFVSGPRRGHFKILISNCLEEEVFIVVQGFDDVGFSFQKETATCSIGGGGGGTIHLESDSRFLLKRLTASSVLEGQRVGIDTSFARVDCRLGDCGQKLEELIGADAKAIITISGYFRADGRSFWKQIEVPIVLVAPPTDQDASKVPTATETRVRSPARAPAPTDRSGSQ